MNTTLTEYLLANMGKFYANPSSMQQVAIDGLALALQGVDIVDATSPFIYLMEVSTCASATSIAKSEVLTRRQYPKLAQTFSDLFHHMSDKEYVGIFGSGSTCVLRFRLPYNQLLNKAVHLTPGSPIKSVIIPRDTQIFVNDITLQIGYSVVINILPGDLIQIYYDTSVTNPLIPYSANIVKYDFNKYDNVNYLEFDLPTIQTASFTKQFTLGQTNSFYQTLNFANYFCYARVFLNVNNVRWDEILTTFSDKVYDIQIPTVLLALKENTLIVTLPDIYQTLNLSTNSIRIDIYTTRGDLTVDLSQVTFENFSAVWSNFDNLNTVNTSAVSALNNINDILISARDALTGGGNPLTFDEAYDRVVYHINSTVAPLRPTDITALLKAKGYATEVLLNKVSSRTYIASKNLPTNTVDGFSASPLATNCLVNLNAANYILNDTHSLSVAVHSSNRATILPSALFEVSNGNAMIVSDIDLASINALTGKPLCSLLNSKNHMYTPFTYVLDYSTDVFSGRVYYLDAPYIVTRNLIKQNTMRTYNIATMVSEISRINTVYRLTLTASIPTNLTEVVCQLAYYDKNSNTTIYLNSNATVYQSQAVFVFDLITNFDLNNYNQIELTNFANGDNINEPLFFELTSAFNILYLVPGSNVGLTTSFDDLYSVPPVYRSVGVIGATYETISLNFGEYLPNLYCPVLENLGTGEYLKYSDDVPAVYRDIVYQSGPDGTNFIIDDNGDVVLSILHNVGDPILNESDQPIMLHRSGDYILSDGKVIPSIHYTNSLTHSIGVTLIDAKYRYATALITHQYSLTLPEILLGYLSNDIKPLTYQLNEQTKLWYTPSGESHLVKVSLGDGRVSEVSGVLSVKLVIYLTVEGLQNTSIQNQTTKLCREVISNQIRLQTLSVSNLFEAIKKVLPTQAVSFSIDEYLPNGADILTLMDTTQSFSVMNSLNVMSDNTLDITNAITVLYKAAQ